jgi:hypothetical protein
MDDNAGRLVDHEQVLVLVERRVWRLRAGLSLCLSRSLVDLDEISDLYEGSLRTGSSIDAHPFLIDQSLRVGA